MGWSDKYKKSINCDNPKGFSQRAHCQGKKKKLSEEGLRDWFGKSKSKDGKSGWVNVVTGGTCASDKPGEGVPKCVSSAKRASMSKAERIAAARRKKRKDPGQQEKSGAAKPTYVSTDKPKMKKEEFELEEAKDKPGKGSGKKDACYHKVKSRYDVWPSAYASGALVKCRKVGAANWGNSTNEEKDHEYSMARSELSTIISAARRLKKKMKGEGNIEAWVQSKITKAADYIDTAADYVESGEHNVDESVVVQDANGNDYVQFIDIIKPEPLKPSKGNVCSDWREVTEQSIGVKTNKPHKTLQQMIDRQGLGGKVIIPKQDLKPANDLSASYELNGEYIDEEGKKCWKGYKKTGTQKLFGKTYNRCVKEGNKSFSQFMEDWQKVNKSDKTDGMSPAAVKAYRRENPGSKLKTAVTGDPKPGSKDAKRRKSFCSRSKGQQDMHNIDCSKTPDKAICKARRRWKC